VLAVQLWRRSGRLKTMMEMARAEFLPETYSEPRSASLSRAGSDAISGQEWKSTVGSYDLQQSICPKCNIQFRGEYGEKTFLLPEVSKQRDPRAQQPLAWLHFYSPVRLPWSGRRRVAVPRHWKSDPQSDLIWEHEVEPILKPPLFFWIGLSEF
jgi:hypothetical protein